MNQPRFTAGAENSKIMNNPIMRAKLQVETVDTDEHGERLTMVAVGKNGGGYPQDGSDEDNTYAHFTPSATLQIYIANPALRGKIKEGEKYYVDFTLADAAPAAD